MARVDYPWECKMMGHEGGDRIFYKAPPKWFDDMKMYYPNKCDLCREWMKSQTDEVRTCTCGAAIPIPAGRKRHIFKRIGPYEPITECHDCSEGRRQPKGSKKRPDREKRKEVKEPKKQLNGFDRLKQGNIGVIRKVIVDPAFYHSEVLRNNKTDQYESRYVHIEHHISGSSNDWTDPAVRAALGISDKSSPTSLVSQGATAEDLLSQIYSYASTTDESIVRDYSHGQDAVARVTYTGDENRLELTILRYNEHTDSYGVITSYDSLEPDDIKRNGWYKSA